MVAGGDDRAQLVLVGVAQLVGGALDQPLKPLRFDGAGVAVDVVSRMRPVAGHRSLRTGVAGGGEARRASGGVATGSGSSGWSP